MARDLNNKVTVITGGAQGIGFEIADNFLKNGAKVIILDINEEVATQAVKTLTSKYGNKAEFLKCDVTKDLELVSKEIIDKYEAVDVLVNNAGIAGENIRKTIGVNAIAVMEWTMKFWEHMRVDNGGKGGTIININSIYGYRVDPYAPVYKASKYAIMGFTKTLGHSDCYEKFGVRIVALCPGFTKTELLSFDPQKMIMMDEFTEYLNNSVIWQTADAVGKAAAEVFERADSGTAWLIEGGKPIEQV